MHTFYSNKCILSDNRGWKSGTCQSQATIWQTRTSVTAKSKLYIAKFTDKWLPGVQHAHAPTMPAQTISAISSVIMSHKLPAIPSVLSPVESPEVNNRMFICVNHISRVCGLLHRPSHYSINLSLEVLIWGRPGKTHHLGNVFGL